MKKQFYLMFLIALFTIFTYSNFEVNANKVDKSEVIFTFDGLQVLAFGNPNKVSNGILDVHHHTPKLEIKEIGKGREKIIASFEGKELYRKVLNISTSNSSNSSYKPSRYYSSDMNKDKKDFRWCLDLESDLFQKQLYLKEDKLFTKIHFNVGTFFTSELIDGKYQFVAGSKVHSFNREIGAPGARLELQQGNNLVISGLDDEVNLPYQIGVNYKIDITNLPPKEMASIDHFGFYYDILKDQSVSRFMPIAVEKGSYFPRPLLCEAVVLSKSRLD
jgi:hypothetical protein